MQKEGIEQISYNYIAILPILFISFLLIIVMSFAANAQQTGASPYIYDAVVPKSQNLEIKNNFMVNSFSGAATYSYSLSIPPGTNGLQPVVSVYYNSHSVGQRPGILESGWTLSESYIQRDTNYTVKNTTDDEFILILEGVSYDLIHNKTNNRFHTKIESFMHIQNISGRVENKNVKYGL